MATPYDEELGNQAKIVHAEWLALAMAQGQLNAAQQNMERAQASYTKATTELGKCVGANIPTRRFVVEGKMIEVRYKPGTTGANGTSTVSVENCQIVR